MWGQPSDGGARLARFREDLTSNLVCRLRSVSLSARLRALLLVVGACWLAAGSARAEPEAYVFRAEAETENGVGAPFQDKDLWAGSFVYDLQREPGSRVIEFDARLISPANRQRLDIRAQGGAVGALFDDSEFGDRFILGGSFEATTTLSGALPCAVDPGREFSFVLDDPSRSAFPLMSIPSPLPELSRFEDALLTLQCTDMRWFFSDVTCLERREPFQQALASARNLGSVDPILPDGTGTVTEPRIEARFVSPPGSSPDEVAALGCFDHFNWINFVRRDDYLANCIRTGDRSADCLNFAPVSGGDYPTRLRPNDENHVLPYIDPPPLGGYKPAPLRPQSDNAPWYYDENDSIRGVRSPVPEQCSSTQVVTTDTRLLFCDSPKSFAAPNPDERPEDPDAADSGLGVVDFATFLVAVNRDGTGIILPRRFLWRYIAEPYVPTAFGGPKIVLLSRLEQGSPTPLELAALQQIGPSTITAAETQLADVDLDGTPDIADNCPFANSSDQGDGGSVAGIDNPTGSGGDGIGDKCQCGDVSDDGKVDLIDVVTFARALSTSGFDAAGEAKCNVFGDAEVCDATDLAELRGQMVGAGSVQQLCAAAVR